MYTTDPFSTSMRFCGLAAAIWIAAAVFIYKST